MHSFYLVAIAVGLAMDVFAVSIAIGTAGQSVSRSQALKLALCFGFFHAAMPCFGWCLGQPIVRIVEGYASWGLAVLLFVIGLKIIYESFQKEQNKIAHANSRSLFGLAFLFLAVATSLDALVVGIAFAVLQFSVLLPAAILGVIVFLFSLVGVLLGKYFRERWGDAARVFGGMLLVLVAVSVVWGNFWPSA